MATSCSSSYFAAHFAAIACLLVGSGCVGEGSLDPVLAGDEAGAASDAAGAHSDGGVGTAADAGADAHAAASPDASSQQHADAGSTADAHTPPNGSGGSKDASVDTGSPEDTSSPTEPTSGADAGATSDETAWLVPQNAARAAVGEPPLTWDPIAAEVALHYASLCDYEHNANRTTDYAALGGDLYVGENIAAGAPTEDIPADVASWVNEIQYYDHATNTCATGQECGHYTQIVWSTTTKVGCAKVSCTTGSPFGTFASGQWDFSVCDYTPGGNIVGTSPY